MSVRFSPQSVGFIAGADLSSSKYFLVKLDTTANQVVLGGAGDEVIGVLLNKPESGEQADVAVAGGAKVEYGGTIAINDKLKCDANGNVVVTTTNNDFYFARAIEAGVDGDVAEVIIEQGFVGA